MSKLIKRLLSLLLCLCLLTPVIASAENARSVAFTLEGEMYPDAYPLKDQKLMQGLSELIGILTLEGTLQYDDAGALDLAADVLLDGDEETRTGVRVYGIETHWGVESTLLGDSGFSMNLQALLEFCMKAYFHLEIPLQRVGLLATPYVHKDGLGALTSLWNPVMNAASDTRTIPRDEVLTMLRQISSVAENDRAFTYWVQALALEAGYDGVISSFMSQLPEWADGFLGEEGVVVTVDGENQTWTSGGTTLFSKTVRDGWTTCSLSLPASVDGYVLNAFFSVQDKGSVFYADLRLTVDQEDAGILDLRLSADAIPQHLPLTGTFALSYDVTGEAMPDGFHLRFEGEAADGAFTLHQKDAVSGSTMLTLKGSVQPADVTSPLIWTVSDLPELEFFSVNDVTLSRFVNDVKGPVIRGLLPLLIHAPMSACQSLMDLVTDTGIFDVLTSSSSDMDSFDEEEYADEEGWSDESFDEENWSEESWDEESWDEESWDEESWDEESWDEESWDEESWDEESWDEESWDEESWDEESWDEESWDEESWDEESWDEESWDEESWDEESWDEEEFDDSMYE